MKTTHANLSSENCKRRRTRSSGSFPPDVLGIFLGHDRAHFIFHNHDQDRYRLCLFLNHLKRHELSRPAQDALLNEAEEIHQEALFRYPEVCVVAEKVQITLESWAYIKRRTGVELDPEDL
ncbi:hypothetical protein CASFOL_017461 [Castilleja foliolosa]|uniref:Uncharacterized protein n=1 Tax=Castilleja foliolosa TaxID=1961234 RepID=A0ABD3DCI5_9LAMI